MSSAGGLLSVARGAFISGLGVMALGRTRTVGPVDGILACPLSLFRVCFVGCIRRIGIEQPHFL